jgi:GntR family transcriptional repressor for pyruvate dehydrogenase complex
MTLHPVKKESISEQVFEQMKSQISSGAWKTGEKLPSETELAGIFHVSRVTIRNALQRLNTMGLIETRFGEGSFVRESDIGQQVKTVLLPSVYLQPHNVEEILQFRCAIEVETAGLAAVHASDDDVHRLKDILKKQLSLKDNVTAFAECDLDFHHAIALSTGNSLIIATYEILRDILKSAMVKTVRSLGPEVGLPYHKKLIEAIENHDEHLAIVTMKEHMRSTFDNFSRAMDLSDNYR